MPKQVRWIALGVVLLGFILIPYALVGARMDAWSALMLERLQDERIALAVFIIVLLGADVLAPVPSSIVAAASGATLGLQLGLFAIAAGLTAGCVMGYAIGRFGGASAMQRMVGPREAARLNALSCRYGNWSVVISRPLPVLAEASSILAGAAEMPFARFLVLTTSANLVIAAAYAFAGAGFLRST